MVQVPIASLEIKSEWEVSGCIREEQIGGKWGNLKKGELSIRTHAKIKQPRNLDAINKFAQLRKRLIDRVSSFIG